MAKVLKGMQMRSPTKINVDETNLQNHRIKALGSRRASMNIYSKPKKKSHIKTFEEIKDEGGIRHFFECPDDVQEVIFNLTKGNKSFIKSSSLY